MASQCSHKLIIMNEEKEICAQRVMGRSAPLSRFNRHSNKDVLDELIKDQLYLIILNELRQKYMGRIFEY